VAVCGRAIVTMFLDLTKTVGFALTGFECI
jgi:hypothetical protein